MKKFFSGIFLILIFAIQSWALEIDHDANDAVDIAHGGSNAVNEAAARVNLGLEIGVDIAAALGANDNYVTDSEKGNIVSLSGTNTGDNAVNTLYADDYRAANFISGTDYEPAKGSDDNFMTDSEKVVIGNTSNTNTGDDPADDAAYDATSWNDNTDSATKNAIRDKIESLAGGHDAVTIGIANGLSLSGQILSMAPGTNSTPGAVTAAQVTDLEENDTDIKIVNRIRDENINWTGINTFDDGIITPGAADGGQFSYWLEATGFGDDYGGWGVYGNITHKTFYMFPLVAPTVGQMMMFAAPTNQTMIGGVTKSISVGTWIDDPRFKALEIADLNDTTTPHVLTINETTNKNISNYASTGADRVFTMPAPHVNGNIIFPIGHAYQIDVEPASGQYHYLNGTAMAVDEHIQNTADTLGERMVGYCVNMNGTLRWMFYSSDAAFVEATP